MYLRKDTAAKIIKEVSMILDYDINIMDENGAILASTDLSRIGMFHEGAFRIIRYHLSELSVYTDQQYQGCRKGINLPISLEDKIIGVIGITGEVAEVVKYGKVLKKMTEILVLDLFSYRQKSQKEQARLFLVNEWISTEPFDFTPSFRDELQHFQLPADGPYIAAVITPPSALENWTDFNNKDCICTQNGEIGIIIYHTAQKSPLLHFITQLVQNSGIQEYLCTIGSSQSDYTGVIHSYKQAQKLRKVKSRKFGIFAYDDCIGELIYNDVSLEYKDLLCNQILAEFTEKEKLEFAEFIRVYVRNNGSVTTMAKELFIHKNTVQYRINKILQKTGKDPRLIQDIVILYMVAEWL